MEEVAHRQWEFLILMMALGVVITMSKNKFVCGIVFERIIAFQYVRKRFLIYAKISTPSRPLFAAVRAFGHVRYSP